MSCSFCCWIALIFPIQLGVFILGENPYVRIINAELQIIDVFTEIQIGFYPVFVFEISRVRRVSWDYYIFGRIQVVWVITAIKVGRAYAGHSTDLVILYMVYSQSRIHKTIFYEIRIVLPTRRYSRNIYNVIIAFQINTARKIAFLYYCIRACCVKCTIYSAYIWIS